MQRFFNFLTAILLMAVAQLAQGQTVGEHGESLDVHGIITDVPADAVINEYERSGMYLFYNNQDGLIYTIDQMGTVNIATCPDGTMFIQDFIYGTKFGTWIMGTKQGDLITIPSHQKVYYDAKYDATISLSCFAVSYSVEDIEEDVSFAIHEKNGRQILSIVGFETYSKTVGLEWDDDYSIYALGDYATEFSFDPNFVHSEQDELVVVPAHVSLNDYKVNCWSYREWRYVNYLISVGFDGSDVYIGGLYNFDPNMFVKGQLQDDVITFPNYQYLGRDGANVPIYAVACAIGLDEYGELVFVDAPNWTLTRNPLTGAYSGGDCVVRFARNPYYKYGNQFESIDEIVIRPVHDNAISSISSDDVATIHYDLQGRTLTNHPVSGLSISGGRVRFVR